MERSLHSRGFRTPCTFRHRCRQSPQRSIRFPSRSMWMIMYLSVSSTLVTVCAFNLSCFLRNVSMSTSILFLSVAVHHSPQKIRCIGDSDQPLHRQPAASKTLRLQLHFRDGNQKKKPAIPPLSSRTPTRQVRLGGTVEKCFEDLLRDYHISIVMDRGAPRLAALEGDIADLDGRSDLCKPLTSARRTGHFGGSSICRSRIHQHSRLSIRQVRLSTFGQTRM